MTGQLKGTAHQSVSISGTLRLLALLLWGTCCFVRNSQKGHLEIRLQCLMKAVSGSQLQPRSTLEGPSSYRARQKPFTPILGRFRYRNQDSEEGHFSRVTYMWGGELPKPGFLTLTCIHPALPAVPAALLASVASTPPQADSGVLKASWKEILP